MCERDGAHTHDQFLVLFGTPSYVLAVYGVVLWPAPGVYYGAEARRPLNVDVQSYIDTLFYSWVYVSGHLLLSVEGRQTGCDVSVYLYFGVC